MAVTQEISELIWYFFSLVFHLDVLERGFSDTQSLIQL